MSKIILASHSNLAKGLKETLEYILPSVKEIIAIPAYIDDKPLHETIDDVLGNISEDEQVIVFTDLMGGSVNQEFSKKIGRNNYFVVAGVNLPLLLNVCLLTQNGDISEEELTTAINESKEGIIFVNRILSNDTLDEDDE
ncbi:PTS sugar transporter subunit IIA [Anaerococcus urinomassiliensis]|uniref:PTS sugar transporter subunit IIA n=1 Tax=Anaerococcus urinomassiliensis TaxID=1745712 RepID=UPI00093DB171|nr:PTS N-acetylglucosamine transporter subunit IIBC [Anaerococcus urinomassiliensis]